MTRIKDSDPIRKLLEKAAATAKGREYLASSTESGKLVCCFWGEAARLLGAAPKKMKDRQDFTHVHGFHIETVLPAGTGDFMEAPGSALWDAGRPLGAVASACREAKGRTVGDFRAFLKAIRLIKPRRKR
jgi:hypothetical protein